MKDIDLNLLRVFDAVYRERSVSRAAGVLGLTQPAVSNAIRRLRGELDDELFIRVGSSLKPTAGAQMLAGGVREAMGLLESTIAGTRSFDPAKDERTFRIGVYSLVDADFVPHMLALVQREAPNVRLEFHTQDGSSSIDTLIEKGNYDVGMSAFPTQSENLVSEPLFSEPLSFIVRHGHPVLEKAPLRLSDLQGLRHVGVHGSPALTQFLIQYLASHGLKRDFVAVVPDVWMIPRVVAKTDLIGIFGLNAARRDIDAGRIVALSTNVDLPVPQVHLVWRGQQQFDAGHVWMRLCVARVLAELGWGVS